MPLTRDSLRTLACARLDEAAILLAAQRWSGSYYLAGYSAELGLKACIAAQFVQGEIPVWAATERFKTHGLVTLLGFADLESDLKEAAAVQRRLQSNWDVVSKWRTDHRYDDSIDERAAREMMTALSDPASGVFTWIRTRW